MAAYEKVEFESVKGIREDRLSCTREQSLQRLVEAGYERHPHPAEICSLIMAGWDCILSEKKSLQELCRVFTEPPVVKVWTNLIYGVKENKKKLGSSRITFYENPSGKLTPITREVTHLAEIYAPRKAVVGYRKNRDFACAREVGFDINPKILSFGEPGTSFDIVSRVYGMGQNIGSYLPLIKKYPDFFVYLFGFPPSKLKRLHDTFKKPDFSESKLSLGGNFKKPGIVISLKHLSGRGLDDIVFPIVYRSAGHILAMDYNSVGHDIAISDSLFPFENFHPHDKEEPGISIGVREVTR